MVKKPPPRWQLPKKGSRQGHGTSTASGNNAASTATARGANINNLGVAAPPQPTSAANNTAATAPPQPTSAANNATSTAPPPIVISANGNAARTAPTLTTSSVAPNNPPRAPLNTASLIPLAVRPGTSIALQKKTQGVPPTSTHVRTQVPSLLPSPPPPPAHHPSPPVQGVVAVTKVVPVSRPVPARFSSFLVGQRSPSPISPIFPIQQLPFNSTFLEDNGISVSRSSICLDHLLDCTCFSIPKASFKSLVRSISEDYGDFRWAGDAMTILQDVAEAYLQKTFIMANGLAHHRRRKTVDKADFKLAIVLQDIIESKALR